jgi:hypothetical protein
MSLENISPLNQSPSRQSGAVFGLPGSEILAINLKSHFVKQNACQNSTTWFEFFL